LQAISTRNVLRRHTGNDLGFAAPGLKKVGDQFVR
jgi:hypothetical protein